MSNFQIPYAANVTSVAIGKFMLKDSANVPRIGTGTISVDDYTSAYVNVNPVTKIIWFVVKKFPDKQASGKAVKTVTVTFTGKAADGTDLVPVTTAFDLVGPDADPLATHIQPFDSTAFNLVNTFDPQVADPGSTTAVNVTAQLS